MKNFIKTPNNLVLINTSSDRQKANGTEIYTLVTNKGEEKFGIYKSGYIRRLPTKENYLHTCYQLNKVVQKPREYQVSGVSFFSNCFYTRELIPKRKDRIKFLLDFIDRNYSTKVCKR